ncbi:MAG TPA: COQ9 family protein [Alphaproteobacteria bacterium]|nr:COQ9 family protein [Alphaproteobacteria bacterium]
MKKAKNAKSSPASGKDTTRRKILIAMLRHAGFDGWTKTAYARALKDAGVARGEADLLLPSGLRDVIDLFGAWADEEMNKRIAAAPGFRHMRVREKIAFAVRARLEALTPHREAMRRLLYWYALPTHMPLGVKRLYKTVDRMWRAAGDASTDFNFYTKRILLAGVVKVTMLFWLDDDSAGCRKSWEFLDRRIGEVLKAGKAISLAREWKPAEIVDFIKRKMGRAV